MQAIGEDENHEQRSKQPHPDSRREEAGTVAGVREIPSHVEALDLVLKGHSLRTWIRDGGGFNVKYFCGEAKEQCLKSRFLNCKNVRLKLGMRVMIKFIHISLAASQVTSLTSAHSWPVMTKLAIKTQNTELLFYYFYFIMHSCCRLCFPRKNTSLTIQH